MFKTMVQKNSLHQLFRNSWLLSSKPGNRVMIRTPAQTFRCEDRGTGVQLTLVLPSWHFGGGIFSPLDPQLWGAPGIINFSNVFQHLFSQPVISFIYIPPRQHNSLFWLVNKQNTNHHETTNRCIKLKPESAVFHNDRSWKNQIILSCC